MSPKTNPFSAWPLLAVLFAVSVWADAAAFAVESLEQPAATGRSAITVELTGGRTFTAELDARTNTAQLWLRWQSSGAALLRPIRWDHVARAQVGGEDLSGEQFRALVEQVRRDTPAEIVETPRPTTIVMIGVAEPAYAAGSAIRPAAAAVESRRVASLMIDARAARWDENVETDGIAVRVYPLDEFGKVVPVWGTLQVDLRAERQSPAYLHEPFSEIGNWAQEVRPEDFARGNAGLSIPLPERSSGVRFDRPAARFGPCQAQHSGPRNL